MGARVPSIPSHKALTWQEASPPPLAVWCLAPGLAARAGRTSSDSAAAGQDAPLALGQEEALQSSPVGRAFSAGGGHPARGRAPPGQQGPVPLPCSILCFSAAFLCQVEKALATELLMTLNRNLESKPWPRLEEGGPLCSSPALILLAVMPGMAPLLLRCQAQVGLAICPQHRKTQLQVPSACSWFSLVAATAGWP